MERPPVKLPLFVEPSSDEFKERYDPKKIRRGILRHWVVLLACTLGFGLLGSSVSAKFLNTQQAKSLLLYQNDRSQAAKLPGGYSLTKLSMGTVMEMSLLPESLEAVKVKLGLNLSVDSIRRLIKVRSPKGNSSLIGLEVRSPNQNLSVDIANTLAESVVESSQKFTKRELYTALTSYQKQREILKKALAVQIREIEQFKRDHQYFEMDPQHTLLQTQMNEARKMLHSATLAYNKQLIEFQNLKKQVETLPEYIPITKESKNSPIQLKIVALQQKLAEAKAKYTAENPKILRLEEHIKELISQNSLSAEGKEQPVLFERNPLQEKISLEVLHLEGQVQSAMKIREQLASNIKDLDREIEKIPSQQMALVRLFHDKEAIEGQLHFLNEAVETVQILLRSPKGSVSLYQKALKATPWKSGLWVELIPLFGLLFGFGSGTCAAMALEMGDAKFRTSGQIMRAYTVPSVTSIPEIPSLQKGQFSTELRFYAKQIAEYVDTLFLKERGCSLYEWDRGVVISVLSSTRLEGKRLIGAHLVSQLEQTAGQSVLVEVSEEGTEQIAEYIDKECAVDSLIDRGSIDTLRIKTRLGEEFTSHDLKRLFDRLKETYRYVVVVSAPTVEGDLGIGPAKYADFSLFVIHSKETKKEVVDQTLSFLEQANCRPSGLILNRVHPVYLDAKRVDPPLKKDKRSFCKRWMKG